MHKVDSTGATPSNEFTNGVPGVTPRTILEAKFMNAVQRELCAPVEMAGGTLSDADDNQIVERVTLHVQSVTALRNCPVAGVNRVLSAFVGNVDSGYGMLYEWDNASASSDDGLTIVRPATNPANGRWVWRPARRSYEALFAPNQSGGTNNTAIANTAFVQAAIAALVDSSPAALDTLNELAAALDNDANFSTTVINALALKAALESPTFTGTPAAPTASGGTNTTQIATTAFVQAALLSLGAAGLSVIGGIACRGKAAATTRSGSDAYAGIIADPDLTVSLPAAGVYRFEALLPVYNTAFGDPGLSYRFHADNHVSSAFSLYTRYADIMTGAGIAGGGLHVCNTTHNYNINAGSEVNGSNYFNIDGSVEVNAPGTFELRWCAAHDHFTGYTTTIGRGAFLKITRLV